MQAQVPSRLSATTVKLPAGASNDLPGVAGDRYGQIGDRKQKADDQQRPETSEMDVTKSNFWKRIQCQCFCDYWGKRRLIQFIFINSKKN